MKVYRSSMAAVIVELGRDIKLILHSGEASTLRDQLTEVLRPRED